MAGWWLVGGHLHSIHVGGVGGGPRRIERSEDDDRRIDEADGAKGEVVYMTHEYNTHPDFDTAEVLSILLNSTSTKFSIGQDRSQKITVLGSAGTLKYK